MAFVVPIFESFWAHKYILDVCTLFFWEFIFYSLKMLFFYQEGVSLIVVKSTAGNMRTKCCQLIIPLVLRHMTEWLSWRVLFIPEWICGRGTKREMSYPLI